MNDFTFGSLGTVTHTPRNEGIPAITVDLSMVPATSAFALVSRGIAHALGNEVAASVVAEIRKTLIDSRVAAFKAEHGRDPNEDEAKELKGLTAAGKAAIKSAITAWRTANPDKVTELEIGFRNDTLGEILDGTLGVREAVERETELDVEIRRLATDRAAARIEKALRANGTIAPDGKFTWPRKKETPVPGIKGDLTKAELVAQYAAKYADELKADAEKAIAKRKADAAKAAKDVNIAEGAEVTAENLF